MSIEPRYNGCLVHQIVSTSSRRGQTLAVRLGFTVRSAEAADKRPIPLVFDTDIGNDIDDTLALGVIHALVSRGECELLAVTITKDHPLSAPFVDAVNMLAGDFNRDGQVNAADLLPMEQALANLPGYQSTHSLTSAQLLLVGDVNADGVVNNADLQALLNFLKSGGGSNNSKSAKLFAQAGIFTGKVRNLRFNFGKLRW